MKRRLYWTLCLVSLAALLVSTVASLFVYYYFYQEQNEADLARQCQALSAGAVASGDPEGFLQGYSLDDSGERITLLSDTGQVLFDSAAAEDSMENHRDRPEFQQALQTGSGEASRVSDTMGISTFYYAGALRGGHGAAPGPG